MCKTKRERTFRGESIQTWQPAAGEGDSLKDQYLDERMARLPWRPAAARLCAAPAGDRAPPLTETPLPTKQS